MTDTTVDLGTIVVVGNRRPAATKGPFGGTGGGRWTQMGSPVRRLSLSLAVFLLVTGPASSVAAQATPATLPEAPRTPPASATFALGIARGGERPFIAWVYSRSLMDHSPDGIRAPREFLLGTVIDGHEVWRSSLECPQIIGALMNFDRMMPAAVALPPLYGYPPAGANARPLVPPPPDSPGYQVWGPGRQAEGSAAYVSVSAGTGLLADLINDAENNVRPCFPPSH